jgi:hypothetical protein
MGKIMTKKRISLSTLGALACSSIIVLFAWTFDTATKAGPSLELEQKKPSPYTDPGLSPGSFPKACAPGFKRVNEGPNEYRCEMVGSTKVVCLNDLWFASSLGIENSGKDGWKISYACQHNPR